MLISISGQKGSGKDTIATILKENYGFTVYSLAGPLKRSLQEAFGLTDAQLYDPNEKEKIHPVWKIPNRVLMQVFGTEIMQIDFPKRLADLGYDAWWGRNLWIERFRMWYTRELLNDANLNVVVPDVRFPHEMEVLKKFNCKFWLVERPGVAKTSHASESELKYDSISWDFSFQNDKSIPDLKQVVDLAMRTLNDSQASTT